MKPSKIKGKVMGVPCEIYSRVVGYFRPVNQWNEGKREEFKDRVPFKISEMDPNKEHYKD